MAQLLLSKRAVYSLILGLHLLRFLIAVLDSNETNAAWVDHPTYVTAKRTTIARKTESGTSSSSRREATARSSTTTADFRPASTSTRPHGRREKGASQRASFISPLDERQRRFRKNKHGGRRSRNTLLQMKKKIKASAKTSRASPSAGTKNRIDARRGGDDDAQHAGEPEKHVLQENDKTSNSDKKPLLDRVGNLLLDKSHDLLINNQGRRGPNNSTNTTFTRTTGSSTSPDDGTPTTKKPADLNLNEVKELVVDKSRDLLTNNRGRGPDGSVGRRGPDRGNRGSSAGDRWSPGGRAEGETSVDTEDHGLDIPSPVPPSSVSDEDLRQDQSDAVPSQGSDNSTPAPHQHLSSSEESLGDKLKNRAGEENDDSGNLCC
ncbi:unnamed protein product [Amoebophrya sp. A120]|nr:unnamed protein product [Amoebophrya sp. A120]|eukprot:GSA120T00013718001.1